MTKIHFLNVNQGDCIILQHLSGRTTVFDISAGNIGRQQRHHEGLRSHILEFASGNYGMCNHPTNPLDYLVNLAIKDIWRFILSHPDMDHLDGFNALLEEFRVFNFWDSGARKDKPDFSGYTKYKEKDWDRYSRVISNKEATTNLIKVQDPARFKYANVGDTTDSAGDGLYILAPSQELIEEANRTQEFNDASYVVLYNTAIGKVLLSGDAHDATWKYVVERYEAAVSDVTLLIAPHHGRKSGRSYTFLDCVRPKLTLFGCAQSQYLAYDSWRYRKLPYITNNLCQEVRL